MARSRPPADRAAAVTHAVARACVGFDSATRVCVALSGGIDSVVLLHALDRARQQAPEGARWRLSAHHVHHGLSAFADDWLAHCEALCKQLGVPFSYERVQVARDAVEGIEAAARNARYASLQAVPHDVMMLAHHQRDQAETVLLQLLRGAGPEGLAAMAGNSTRGMRPLLAVDRASIEDYASQHALRAVVDDSNADTRFARNRLRLEVWPRLLQAFPAAERTLARAAWHQADAANLLRELAMIDAVDATDGDTLQLARLHALSQLRQANLLRHWLDGHSMLPAAAVLDEWMRQLRTTRDNQSIILRRSGRDRRSLRVYRGRVHVVDDVLPWHEQRWLGETGVQLKGEPSDAGWLDLPAVVASAERPALRLPAAHEHWLVRARREGDAIRLSETSGHVSLKNIMQAAAIPPWLRDTWPLLECDGEVVAVASVATAKAYTVRAGEVGRLCEWKPACRVPSRS